MIDSFKNVAIASLLDRPARETPMNRELHHSIEARRVAMRDARRRATLATYCMIASLGHPRI